MTATVRLVAGQPTGEEAAAVIAAVQVLVATEARSGSGLAPWPYRSGWRRAAIEEGVERMDVS